MGAVPPKLQRVKPMANELKITASLTTGGKGVPPDPNEDEHFKRCNRCKRFFMVDKGTTWCNLCGDRLVPGKLVKPEVRYIRS